MLFKEAQYGNDLINLPLTLSLHSSFPDVEEGI